MKKLILTIGLVGFTLGLGVALALHSHLPTVRISADHILAVLLGLVFVVCLCTYAVLNALDELGAGFVEVMKISTLGKKTPPSS